MLGRISLITFAVLFSAGAEADGPNAIALQQLLRAAPTTGLIVPSSLDLSQNPITVNGQQMSLGAVGAQQSSNTLAIQNLSQAVTSSVQSVGGDASQTHILAPGATQVQTLSSKLGEHVSVADFGAVGGATTYYLASAANVGDQAITLAGNAAVQSGNIVDGYGTPAGTTVVSSTYSAGNGSSIPATTLVALSKALTAASAAGQRFDFAIQDDYPAFIRAQKSGAKYIEVPAGPTREYYLSNYAGNVPGIVWKLDGAYFAQNGGIVEGVNQSMTQNRNSEALLNSMQDVRGEDTLLVTSANQPSNSPASYQKNVIHVQLNQGDPSAYSFLGDSQTVVRDIVGYSVQGHCPTGNVKCSMFGSEAAMTMDPSSDGSIVGYEISVANLSGNPGTEMGSWNNKGALTLIGTGSTMGAGMWVHGSAWQTGIDLSTEIIGKAWAVRTEGGRNASGVATTHTDYAYVDHLGSFFAQTAHIGGGATVGDTDPIGGVVIMNDPAGRIAIGNASAAAGLQPSLEFHLAAAAAADSYTSRLVQTSSGLQVQTSGGTVSASFHPDGSTELSGFLVQTHAAGLASASTPTSLSAHFSTIASCPAGSSVMLPAKLPIGGDVYVLNRCGASFTVLPPSGGMIESNSAGTGISIASGTTQHFFLESATQWRQLQ